MNMPTDPMPSLHDERETLSALFDGELDGERARFALKRLGHDADWRATCERWQLAGDALRGRGAALAAGGLAERVAAAVAAEPRPAAVQRPVRRWGIGGVALAASVAAAALLLTQLPPSQQSGADAPVRVAAAPAPAATPARRVAATEPAPRVAQPPLAAATSADTPRIANDRRIARAAPPSRRARSAEPAASQPGDPGINSAIAAAPPVGATSDPFGAPAEIVTRPWPQAVLPRAGAFDVDYSGAPAFHPFQPQMPDTRAQPPDGN